LSGQKPGATEAEHNFSVFFLFCFPTDADAPALAYPRNQCCGDAMNGRVSALVIRNVVVGGRRTSVRLEPVIWDALADIAERGHRSVNGLVTEIERDRTASSLTAAIRVYVVDFYRAWAIRNGAISVDRSGGEPKHA
jgi:predicted DNA-binding ribbon-helix-helix protein